MDPSQSSRSSSSPLQSGSSISAAIAEEHMDDAFEVSALFVLAESLVGQGRGAGDRLCHEVEALTHGHAQLQVFHSPAPGLERATLPQALPHRYPVTFDGNTYGMLWVAPDRENPAQPAIANATARALA